MNDLLTNQPQSNASPLVETNEPRQKLLKVGASTDSNSLAGSIQATYDQDNSVQIILRTIGAASLNQAVKASIISNRHFSKKGLFVSLVPCFNDLQPDLTAVELKVRLVKI